MIQKSESIGRLVKALVLAQQAFDPVLKDKDNPFFHSKYADLASVIAATQPALLTNGLVISQFPVSEAGRVGVLTLLAHESGEFVAESYTLPTAKQDPQTGVAAITYARRAAYLGVISIAAQDDDGNTAAGRNEEESEAPRPARPKRVVSEAPAIDRGSKPNVPEPPPMVEEIPVPMPVPQQAVGITGGTLPDRDALEKYRVAIVNLQKELADYGGLKPSRGLTVSRKILLYLLKTAGASEASQITVQQWDTIFAFFNKTKESEGGIANLAKLIDAAAKSKE